MKKLLAFISIILFSAQLFGQNSKNNLIGKYTYYFIKEDAEVIYSADTVQYPIKHALYEKIKNSFFEITPDSLLVIDASGGRKGWEYTLKKGKKELLVNDGEEKSPARYIVENQKLYLFLDKKEKHSEVILIKKQ